jgi:hypothetical protein
VNGGLALFAHRFPVESKARAQGAMSEF